MDTAIHTKSSELNELCAGFFSLIIQLRSSQQLGDPSELRRRITSMFTDMEAKAKVSGAAGEDVQLARYALTAFIDETVLNSSWPGKEEWVKYPLQLEYFGTHLAGEEFYEKLKGLRERADSRIDALEIFYTCMQLGYEGKYKILGLEKLMMIKEETGRDIARIRGRQPRPLSAHWERSQGLIQGFSQELPLWVAVVTCAALLFFLFTGLALWISHDAASWAEKLVNLIGKGAA